MRSTKIHVAKDVWISNLEAVRKVKADGKEVLFILYIAIVASLPVGENLTALTAFVWRLKLAKNSICEC